MITQHFTCTNCDVRFVRSGRYVYTFCSRLCGNTYNQRMRAARLARRSLELRQPKSYKLIALTRGRAAKVSNRDFEALARLPWAMSEGYASRGEVRMHVYIMRELAGLAFDRRTQPIDHRNGNKLDNRRRNLRIATSALNMANRAVTKASASGFKGVWLDKRGFSRPWRAAITLEGARVVIGYFATKEEAAYVYDQFALVLFGDFGRFNLIDK